MIPYYLVLLLTFDEPFRGVGAEAEVADHHCGSVVLHSAHHARVGTHPAHTATISLQPAYTAHAEIHECRTR